ncbi:MAG: rod shape-determining protein [Patescibacteria group bacterium]|nr:rod shape-determining protein [Patescibacteria group bacterium]MCL5095665.1 rod shape-determining protein [Patescibacteria group bacterium]
MFDSIFALFSHDLAIDLGTANILVLVKGKGIVIREPSCVARQKKTKRILAIGFEAKKMMGKTPGTIEAFRPLRDGVIADFDATEAILTSYIKKVHQRADPDQFPRNFMPTVARPRVVIGIPSGVTEVERRAVQEAALAAGARKAYLIEEPMAAAIGAGLPIKDAGGSFICDIGGGTTEMAVISLGGIVVSRCLRTAGDEMDEAIIAFCRLKYSLLIGETTAEEVKMQIGSAYPLAEEKNTVIRGRDLETGLPKSIKIGSAEIREALAPVLNEITEGIAEIIEETPPELVGDLMERGLALAGGGSLLAGMEKLVAQETKMPVWRADDPQTCVVKGCGKVLEDEALLAQVRVTGGLR